MGKSYHRQPINKANDKCAKTQASKKVRRVLNKNQELTL